MYRTEPGGANVGPRRSAKVLRSIDLSAGRLDLSAPQNELYALVRTDTIPAMADERVRHHTGVYVGTAEVVIYSLLAVLLFITAFAAVASGGVLLWKSIVHREMVTETLHVLDQLLVVLMLVEILHTVRISIRSHVLVMEPFLAVGLIASIRRILLITLEAATLTKQGSWSADGASIFRASMIELGLLGFLVLILVFSITLLRRYAAAPETLENA